MFKTHLVKQLLFLFLDVGAWRESGNRFACPLTITFNCMACIQNTSHSGLNSVSHMAAGSCSAMPLALRAPVAHIALRSGSELPSSPSLWTWQGCTARPWQMALVMSSLKIKMCENWISVCACRWNTPNCPVSICPNWSCYRRWSSARLNSYWGITKRLDTKQEPDWKKNIKKVWKLITGQTLEGKQLSRRCEVQPMTCRELQGSVKL